MFQWPNRSTAEIRAPLLPTLSCLRLRLFRMLRQAAAAAGGGGG